MDAMFTPNHCGVAIIAGRVSGNLEIFDVDDPHLVQPFIELACRYVPKVTHAPVVRTPSGGIHLYVRCEDRVPGNLKLAMATNEKGDIATSIETRGEGGYAIAPGSPAECHALRKEYHLIGGSLSEIPRLTTEERALLVSCARSFGVSREEVPRSPQALARKGNRPGDEFNSRATWAEILEPHGWSSRSERDGVMFWRRPGKTDIGISATTNFAGSDLLYVFSTNAQPLAQNEAYTKFRCFTVLTHGGDFSAAARALALEGYGAGNNGKGDSLSRPKSKNGGATRKPLPEEIPSVPDLAEELLPEVLRAWLGDAAERLQVPLEMVAVPAIVSLASVVGRTVGIAPKRHDDWIAVPNLWGAIIGRPGILKSPAVLEGSRFVRLLAAEASERYRQALKEAELSRQIVELELAGLKKRGAAKNADRGQLKRDLSSLLEARAAAVVVERRYETQDPTVEKLGDLLNQNPRGLLLTGATS